MQSKLIIAGAVLTLLSAGPVFAHEGMDHDEMAEEKGAMMEGMEHGGMMEEKSSMTDDSMAGEGESHVATEEELKTLPQVGNKICPVSKDQVNDGTMGESVKYVYNGKVYNLCCPMCIKDFKKDPQKYSKIAEDEVAPENAGQ